MPAKLKVGPATFNEIFDAMWPRVCSYFYKRTHDAYLAEDLAQDTFANVWLDGQPGAGPASAVFTSDIVWAQAGAAWRRHLTDKKRAPDFVPLGEVEPAASEVEDDTDQFNLQCSILRFLESRPGYGGRIVVLRHLHGKPWAEIIDSLPIGRTTVFKLYKRTLEEVASRFADADSE